MGKNFIAKATMHKGALHRNLGISPTKTIPVTTLKAAAKRKGVVGKEARLALTLRSLHKK